MLTRKILAVLVLLTATQCTPHHRPAKNTEPKPRPKPTELGEALSPFTYLRKMSLHIRGLTPERSEYDGLTRAIEKNQTEEFLRQRLDQYLISEQHIDKMTFRLEELFALRASHVPYYSPLTASSDIADFPIHNAMNELMRTVISRNLSWDTLLTGKRYTAFPIKPSGGSLELGDLKFLATAAGTPMESPNPIDVRFSDSDARVAGLLTTSRFFGRNVNTALNKNRRRAAAVFRTFLCDPMSAVVVSEKGNEGAILDKIFPGAGGTGPIRQMEDLHGAAEDCMKCHVKLDPMGKTFQSSGMVLAPLASPGGLVFTNYTGKKIDIPVNGVGELATAITQQDDYVRCQVKHFWSWFIGDDKALDEGLMGELVAKFNEVRRRPNDFVAYLVSRPEFGFSSGSGSNGVLIAEVKGVLRNCTSCHAVNGVPDFTVWPIGGDEATHARWLGRIRSALSLDGSTRPRTMPPACSGPGCWQPTPAQLANVQQWLDLGAPNE